MNIKNIKGSFPKHSYHCACLFLCLTFFSRLHYQPLFGKRDRAPPPNRAREVEMELSSSFIFFDSS